MRGDSHRRGDGLVGLAGVVLRAGVGDQLYRAIAMSSPGARHFALLDGYLAGLVAYTTIIDLGGRPRWRNALWLTLGVYAVASLATLRTTVLSVLVTLLLGRAIGLAVRYAAGSMSQRPGGEAIAAALAATGAAVTELRRVDGTWVRRRGGTRRSPAWGSGSTSGSSTGTSRRRARSTGCTGWSGCAGRSHGGPR